MRKGLPLLPYGASPDNTISFLEPVQFLDYGNRNDDIVITKLVNAGTVMKDDIGVQNKGFFHRELRS